MLFGLSDLGISSSLASENKQAWHLDCEHLSCLQLALPDASSPLRFQQLSLGDPDKGDAWRLVTEETEEAVTS